MLVFLLSLVLAQATPASIESELEFNISTQSARQKQSKSSKKKTKNRPSGFQLFPPFTGKRTLKYGAFGLLYSTHQTNNLKLSTNRDYLMTANGSDLLYMTEMTVDASEAYHQQGLNGFYIHGTNIYNRAYMQKLALSFARKKHNVYTIDEASLLDPFRIKNPSILEIQAAFNRVFQSKHLLSYGGLFLGASSYSMELMDYQNPEGYKSRRYYRLLGKSYPGFANSPTMKNRQLSAGLDLGVTIFGSKRPDGTRSGIELNGQYGLNTQDIFWKQNISLAFTL